VELAPLQDPVLEPFGFVDGISQPVLRGVGSWTEKDSNQVIEPGEIVLGYSDNGGYMPPSPTVTAIDDPGDILPAWDPDPFRQRPNFSPPPLTGQHDLGCNGTFLVVRQLEQDAVGFNAFLDEAAAAVGGDPRAPTGGDVPLRDWIAAKMVGRWSDGTSLVRHPHRPGSANRAGVSPDNEFQFGAEDPDGQRCLFGAHIRRANPRDSFAPGSAQQRAITNRHRILRVGRPYRPEQDTGRRGLMFMCLNADIERQFEFVQQTWVLGPSFHGLENEVDPIVGCSATKAVFNIPTPNGPLRLKGLKDFVKVRGGGYFFLPGRKAVRFLAQAIPESKSVMSPWTVQPNAMEPDMKAPTSAPAEPSSETVTG